MDEDTAATIHVVLNILYCLMAATLVIMAVPSLRARLATLGGRQAYAWRYGRWLGSRAPTPQWTRLLEREDLPQESA